MLAIRLQRTGRKGHAQYRIIAQDSRFTPTSGRIAAQLGTFNPHTKAVVLNVELTQKYLDNGAQPSDRMIVIMQKEGVKIPSWVKMPTKYTVAVKHSDKLRKNRTAEVKAEEPVIKEAPAEIAEAVEEAVEAQ